MQDTTKIRIKAFLVRSFHDLDVQDEQDIFDLGFVNSLFAMQLVLFVEKEFGITIENNDLDVDNFRTVNAITRLIEQKRASRLDA